MTNLIPLTDTRGRPLLSGGLSQPNPGSIVLTDGEWGTAWQRHFSTGRWHPTRGGGSVDWDTLSTRRNLVLVYNAPPRPDHRDKALAPQSLAWSGQWEQR
jgi:hypothetical protein